MTLLHLGCGRRFHPAWQNLDFAPLVDGVIIQDLTQPLPYSDNSADAAYISHVLGHLPDTDAANFLREVHRVLKPGATFRLVVPDLRQIVDQYQTLIQPLVDGDLTRADDYRWNQIELYDQVQRSTYGGKMMAYLGSGKVSNRDYVISRNGEEVAAMIDPTPEGAGSKTKFDLSHLPHYFNKARLKGAELAVQLLAGSKARQAFKMGAFRTFSGEVQWRVYDQYSLTRDLREAGFTSFTKQSASTSHIPDFPSYNFDTNESGQERKPESLYLETSK